MTPNNPHMVNWFEIPATDIQRASSFYENIFATTLNKQEFQGTKMAMFHPGETDKDTMVVHGALVEGDGYAPSNAGPLIYLNGGNDLSTTLSRVEAAGGKVTLPKTSIGEHGFMAYFEDTEGNRLALHSPN